MVDFSAFNMLVRMQPGSIPAAACSLKQYLYLNNVDKLNVIFNVWYECIWQILIWAADWLKMAIFGTPLPSPGLRAEPWEMNSSVFLALICYITSNCPLILWSSVMALLWKLPDKISIHPSFHTENKTAKWRMELVQRCCCRRKLS